jgi:beta-mannosidase
MDRKTLFSGLAIVSLTEAALFQACTKAEAGDALSLSGTDWRIHEDPQSQGVGQKFFEAELTAPGWIPAQVPGNIQADVEAAHLVGPLWYGAVNTNLYEVARKDWWYRKDFMVPATYAGRRITLDFGGVDEHCKVWLNGTLIGENRGMFRRFWFDVTGVAVPGQTNHLAVQINRMPEALVPMLIGSDGAFNGPVGGLMDRTRQILKDLKTPGDLGFDWSANVWTLGIWKDVHLEATGPVRIDWTRVETTLDSNYTHATVHAILEVDSLSDLPVQVEFSITSHGQHATKRVAASITKGFNLIKAELSLDRPALWWPNGQGDQPLYTLDAKIHLPSGGLVDDASSTRFGVREFRWGFTESPLGSKTNDVLDFNGGRPEVKLRQLRWLSSDPALANFTNRYQLFVNGRAVRTIGSAPILPYLLPGCGESHELQLLHFVKNAGMNFLRLNGGGGGPLFDEAWYDLADELGIMISYEYPVACTVFDSDPVLLTNLSATCRSMIKRSRNHPSIVEYVGGSEMGYIIQHVGGSETGKSGKDWNALAESPAVQLMRKIAEEENDRLFRVTDPELGSMHGPWVFNILEPAFSYNYYNGEESDTMRYSEFGTASPANLEVWRREIPLQSQWPLNNVNNPILIYHNGYKAAFTDIDWLYEPWIVAAFGLLDNLHDFVSAGQYYGAEGLRYIYDALRRKGKRIGGFTNHTFSEPWPNAAGSYMVDYDGRPLMNYDFLKQALAPISLSLKIDSCLYTPATGIQAELFLVSDAPKATAGLRAKWVARDRKGAVFDHGESSASIAPLEVKSLGTITLHPPKETTGGLVLLELHLEDSGGKVLVERVQIFGQGDIPHPFAGLLNTKSSVNSVSRTALQVMAASVRIEGDQEVLALQVKNTGTMTALFCEPHPLLVYRTDLFIDNNNCSIPPGESREIVIRASSHPDCGLSLAQTGWTISTWNADDVPVAPSAEVLLSMGRWDKTCGEFAGYFDVNHVTNGVGAVCIGNRPDAGKLSYQLSGSGTVQFEFSCTEAQANHSARLRIHTSDQAESAPTEVQITINGRTEEKLLPKGLGIQRTDPTHLAFPATIEFDLAGSDLRTNINTLTVRVVGDGWFSWDALDLVRKP